MNLALSCFKYLLFFFNLVVSLLGVATLAVSIWVAVDPSFFEMNKNFQVPNINSVIYVAIVVGLLMMSVGFLGCWGAFHDNKCMLLSYVIIVTILLIVQVVIAALVLKAVNDTEIQGKINGFLKQALKPGSKRNEFVEALEVKLECCGIEGPRDYMDNRKPIPPSCFGDSNDYYNEGCLEKSIKFINKYATKIGAIVLGAFFVQLIAGIIAVCLYCSVKTNVSEVV